MSFRRTSSWKYLSINQKIRSGIKTDWFAKSTQRWERVYDRWIHSISKFEFCIFLWSLSVFPPTIPDCLVRYLRVCLCLCICAFFFCRSFVGFCIVLFLVNRISESGFCTGWSFTKYVCLIFLKRKQFIFSK